MAHSTIPDAADFLWRTGLLGEINRVVLHPRGLMLSVAAGDGPTAFHELIRSDDPEGIEFGPESLADIEAKLAASGFLDPLPDRERGIGYVIQPLKRR